MLIEYYSRPFPLPPPKQTIMTLLGVGELFPGGEYMDYLTENFCDDNSTFAGVCYNFLFLIAGPDSDELNEVRAEQNFVDKVQGYVQSVYFVMNLRVVTSRKASSRRDHIQQDSLY